VERPAAVKDLAAVEIGAGIELGFTPPDQATDGQGLSKPLEIEIVRTIRQPGEKPGPAVLATPVVLLQGAGLARRTAGGKVRYRDSLASAEFRRLARSALTYRVRGLTRGFRGRPIEGDWSNTITLQLLDVPEPPSGLGVESTASALQLHWSPPSETLTGKPVGSVTAYRIYRSDTGRAGPYHPAGDSSATTFADSSFEFGHAYCYRVRALVTEGNQTAESADSASVEIVPRDVFPPAPPAGLTGLYTANAVELIWNANAEADLAGYNIYRSGPGEQRVKLNAELLRSPLYHDPAVTSGRRYVYRVTAVDLKGNESAPSAEVSVGVP
jgi:hypothetical protein